MGLVGDLIQERAVIPGRVTDGVMRRLIIEVQHMFLHPLEVLRAALGLHEAAPIGFDRRRVGITERVEEAGGLP